MSTRATNYATLANFIYLNFSLILLLFKPVAVHCWTNINLKYNRYLYWNLNILDFSEPTYDFYEKFTFNVY